MKANVVGIGKWLLIAGVSFGFGWAVKPAPPAEEASGGLAKERGKPSSSSSHRYRRLTGGGDSQNRRSGSAFEARRARTAGEGGGWELGSRTLSESQIQSLGLEMSGELDPIKRRAMFDQLLAGMTAENAMEIREKITHLSQHGAEFRDFHYAWGRIAGQEAIAFAKDSEERDMDLTLAGWASGNPGAAMGWLRGLQAQGVDGPYGNPERYKHAILAGVANANLGQATELVREMASTDEKNAKRMYKMLAGKATTALGPAEAAAWVQSLPSDGMNDWAVGHVARHYARKDPEAAANWLGSMNGGAAQTGAYRQAFSEWAGRDPHGASKYLSKMSASPARDSAITGLVERCRWSDPAAAVAWADAISSPQTRERYLAQAGQAYYARDPEGAARWVQEVEVSDKLRKKIVSIGEKTRKSYKPKR